MSRIVQSNLNIVLFDVEWKVRIIAGLMAGDDLSPNILKRFPQYLFIGLALMVLQMGLCMLAP